MVGPRTPLQSQCAYYGKGVQDDASSSGSESPIRQKMDDETMASFPSGKPREEPLETVICKHCRQKKLKRTAKEHIAGCFKSKQDKARKKKEAREAAARAKEKAERGDDKETDEESEIKVDSKGSSARKSAVKGGAGNEGSKKSKKRKADVEDDKEPKKKKKKEEPKPKAPKPKGPVDVEKQCGVTLPNSAQCARSLTCKSHSMGSKRAVPGRSLPYDMLLQAYQKKNQAKMQSMFRKGRPVLCELIIVLFAEAAIDANAPLLLDDDLDPTLNGPVDSDEERDAVMAAISRGLARPQPLATHTLFPTRRKYQLVRMKEMLSNAINGNRSGGLFTVATEQTAVGSTYPRSAFNEGFAMPSAITPSSAIAGFDVAGDAQRRGSIQAGSKAASRKPSVSIDVS